MSATIVVGLDGGATGDRAVDHASKLAGYMNACELVLVYVIEWSPFSFQTAEENEQRHKRREEEIATALERVVNPAVEKLTAAGVSARGIVKHGDVADTLERVAAQNNADQIVVGRASETGIKRLFGSSTVSLVMHASVPVTVVS